jgi:hypothetical protein
VQECRSCYKVHKIANLILHFSSSPFDFLAVVEKLLRYILDAIGFILCTLGKMGASFMPNLVYKLSNRFNFPKLAFVFVVYILNDPQSLSINAPLNFQRQSVVDTDNLYSIVRHIDDEPFLMDLLTIVID